MLNQERYAGHKPPSVVDPEMAMTYSMPQPGQAELSDSELARHLHDPARHDLALEMLVHRYQAMVRTLAHQYQLPAQHYEDLTQAGYVGLMKAINNFDPTIRPDLKAYARACVDGEIKRYFRDKRWLIRVSRSDQELLLAAKTAQVDLAAEIGGTPTDDDVADRLKVTTGELRHAYQAHQAFAPGSIDAPVSGDDDRGIGEVIGAEDPQLAISDTMDAVQQHWKELPTTQREVLLMRFYGNMTQAQVADRLHCSQMHVSRLQNRALTFLRKQLQAG
jgi:RNA polymerase sigma-B factor